MAEATQTDTTTTTLAAATPAATPPMPFPAERLIGEHLKANIFDFAEGFQFHGVNADTAIGLSQRRSFADSFQAKLLSDGQNLAVKITTDAAAVAQKLTSDAADNAAQMARNASLAAQSGFTLNQQNLNPVSQGEGESADSQSYPPNRAIDSNTALGTGVTLVNVANALAQAVQALAALTPVLATASGGASTPSQTQAKPTTPTAA